MYSRPIFLRRWLHVLPLVLGIITGMRPASAGDPVEAATKPDKPYVAKPTRTLADLPSLPEDGPLDRFGGLERNQAQATGFFRVAQTSGRWWLIDPDGGRFMSRGMNSVATVPTKGGRAALEKLFIDAPGWAAATTKLLHDTGFNTTGAWSDHDTLARAEPKLATCRLWSFMSSYGKKRGGTFMQAGHVGYPNDCPFIFDPEFPEFCREHARQLTAGKDDPWILGHFSDNEMPWSRKLLEKYLALPNTDPGHRAAQAWLSARRGGQAGSEITDTERLAFLEHAVDTYLTIVATAIRAEDPNHLFLGVRLHEPAFDLPEVYRAAGRHCDIVSVNYYRAWTPDPKQMEMWAREAKKPFMVTEHYAKGADSGMGNTGGAGWLVKTQQDRGRFYQNFALGLLESRHCVGWHWHRYADNDPDDKKVDPSNRDSNKGIVSARYEPWQPLVAEMKPFNERVYGIIDVLDAPAPETKPKKDRTVVFPEDIRVQRDVAYLPPDRKQKADLYFPAQMRAGEKLPAVVIIHGGGFNDGDKDRRREINIGANLARKGYVGMSIDYKLWNKGVKSPTWPQSVLDAKSAVRWLRQNADRLGVDPDRLGAIGCSAGGNLVSMLAVTGPSDGLEPPGDETVPTSVRCAVNFYGAVDLLNYHDMKMFLKTREEDPEVYKKASPISYCTKGDAPILLVHGTGDETVDVSQSETFAKALEAGGVEHDLIVIEDAPHTFDLDYEAFDVKTPVIAFFDKYLKQP